MNVASPGWCSRFLAIHGKSTAKEYALEVSNDVDEALYLEKYYQCRCWFIKKSTTKNSAIGQQ